MGKRPKMYKANFKNLTIPDQNDNLMDHKFWYLVTLPFWKRLYYNCWNNISQGPELLT